MPDCGMNLFADTKSEVAVIFSELQAYSYK